MSRYVLFGGEDHERLGGGRYLISSDDLDKLKSAAKKAYKRYCIYDPTCNEIIDLDWFSILDTKALDIVFDHYQVDRG